MLQNLFAFSGVFNENNIFKMEYAVDEIITVNVWTAL